MDHRDRLILALSALLKAERETRAAFEAAIAADQLKPEVLEAILADPVPVVTTDDIAFAEAFLAAHTAGDRPRSAN